MSTPKLMNSIFQLCDPLDELDAEEVQLQKAGSHIAAVLKDPNNLKIVRDMAKNRYGYAIDGLLYYAVKDGNHKTVVKLIEVINKDDYKLAVTRLIYFCANLRFNLMSPKPKNNLCLLVSFLIEKNIPGIWDPFFHLVKQINSSSPDMENHRACKTLLEALLNNNAWFESLPTFVRVQFIYTFLRLISDNPIKDPSFKHAKIKFVVRALKSRFVENCWTIGRDSLRLIRQLALNGIPEFQDIWKRVCENPGSLDKEFLDVYQILSKPTDPWNFSNALTQEMEGKMIWLFSGCIAANSSRNYSWFAKRFLTQATNECIFVNLIRYICAGHFRIDLSCSQRYMIVGKLFANLHGKEARDDAKLAMLYDWLFFDERTDIDHRKRPRVTQIVTALEVMTISYAKYPNITTSLISYLDLISSTFLPSSTTIYKSLRAGLKAVLNDPSTKSIGNAFLGLYRVGNLDSISKEILSKILGDLITGEESVYGGMMEEAFLLLDGHKVKEAFEILKKLEQQAYYTKLKLILTPKLSELHFEKPSKINVKTEQPKSLPFSWQFFQLACNAFRKRKNVEYTLLVELAKENEGVVMNFCSFCLSGIVGKVVTCNVSLTKLFTDFFGKVYEGDKIWKGVDVYINYLFKTQDVDFAYNQLLNAFVHLGKLTTGNEELIKLFFSLCDPQSVYALHFEIMRGELRFFGDDMRNMARVLQNSLNWPSYDQCSLWQIVQFELSPYVNLVERLLSEINLLEAANNPESGKSYFYQTVEAQTGLTSLLLKYQPTPKILQSILCYTTAAEVQDFWSDQLLFYWSRHATEEFQKNICVFATVLKKKTQISIGNTLFKNEDDETTDGETENDGLVKSMKDIDALVMNVCAVRDADVIFDIDGLILKLSKILPERFKVAEVAENAGEEDDDVMIID